MALKSAHFAGDPKLEAAAQRNPAHIVPGAQGEHVSKIQGAVMQLDGAVIADAEITSRSYGKTTAAAVLAYKTRRDIVNRSYQQAADNVTGIMTLARMDEELAALEHKAGQIVTPPQCGRGPQAPSPILGQYEYGAPMSDAEMIAHLQGGTSPESRRLVADLGGGKDGPLIAARMPAPRRRV